MVRKQMGRIATELQGMEHKINRNAGIKGSERVDSLVGTATITDGKSIYQSKILTVLRDQAHLEGLHTCKTHSMSKILEM